MKRIVSTSLLASGLVFTAACSSMSAAEHKQVKAAATCIDEETEAARKSCMDTEIAAMTALEREKVQEADDARAEAERREAIRQAYGIPEKYARESYEIGLKLPGEGQ